MASTDEGNPVGIPGIMEDMEGSSMHIDPLTKKRLVLPGYAGEGDGAEDLYRNTWAALLIGLLGAVFLPRKL